MLTFGIPNQRGGKAPEIYPNTAVLTIEPVAVEKGKSSKIRFNQKAVEVLGFDFDGKPTIAFSFMGAQGTFLINSTEVEGIAEKDHYRVYKNASVSNKKLHSYLIKIGYTPGDYELVAEQGAYKLVALNTELQSSANLATETNVTVEDTTNEVTEQVTEEDNSDNTFEAPSQSNAPWG